MATVRTRKRGNTYTYIFEAGKKPDGKRRTITKGGYATKAKLAGDGLLSDAVNNHLYYGLHHEGDSWVLREWAPNASRFCGLRITEAYTAGLLTNYMCLIQNAFPGFFF